MNILIIQTGGTIDKDYPTSGIVYSFEITEPAANRVLALADPDFKYRTLELLKKDSTDITAEDRQLILKTCREAPETHIVITHGTDTMCDTARELDNIPGKTIVITGSMRPERFVGSDASFNLGTAIGALPLLQPGAYIAMNGRVLPWDKIVKHYGESNKFMAVNEA